MREYKRDCIGGYIGGLYRENGQENGSYYLGIEV